MTVLEAFNYSENVAETIAAAADKHVGSLEALV